MFPTSCKGSNPICYSRFLWHVLLFYFSFLHLLHQLTFHFRCCHFLSWICSSCMKLCFKKLLDMYRNPFYWLSSFLMLLQLVLLMIKPSRALSWLVLAWFCLA